MTNASGPPEQGGEAGVSTEHQTFSELCPTKATLQRTQLSDVKLKTFFTSYRRLKTQKHSVSIGLFCSGFAFWFFFFHFNRQFTEAVFLYSKP